MRPSGAVRVLGGLLLLVVEFTSAVRAEPTASTWLFQGTVQAAEIGLPTDHPFVTVGADPRFHLRVLLNH